MKVLFITHPLAFQSPGGGELIILQSQKALLSQGIQVDLFDPWVHKIENYDLVHVFSCLTWWDWKTIKSYKKPLVVTPTLWADKSSLDKKIELLKDFARSRFRTKEAYSLRGYLPYPDILFPTTVREADLLNRFYDVPNEKMLIIGNGVIPPVRIEAQDNSFAQNMGISDYILFSGSIRPNKNVDVLIKACQQLKLRLVIMGESSFDTIEYEKHCRAIAEKETVFVGYKEKGSREYDEIFNGCKAVIIPSDFETFCLAAAEAASLEKPVIIPSKGGTRCVFKEQGFYVNNAKSLVELSDVIARLMGLPSQELANDLKILSQRIIEEYSWSEIGKKMLEGYKLLV